MSKHCRIWFCEKQNKGTSNVISNLIQLTLYIFQLGEQSQCDLNSNFTSSGAYTFIHEQRYNFTIISVLFKFGHSEKATKIGNNLPLDLTFTKGQLISKANFEAFIWTTNRTKIFLYICPSSLKQVKSRKECKLLYCMINKQ